VTLVETWQALERLVDEGHCKSIGLSDVTLEKVREIVAAARIKAAVVQVEAHPYLPEWDLLHFCREHGIVLLAFAALGHGMSPKVLDDPVITGIAQRVHKTPAQVALAWAVRCYALPAYAGDMAQIRVRRRASWICRLHSAARKIGTSIPQRSARCTRSPIVCSPSVGRAASKSTAIEGR
jgi:diketogulonate reductase-like aldo/keto reductase